MKFVELCSHYKPKGDFYFDKISDSGEFELDKLEYYGIECDCMTLKNANDCSHSKMISDVGLINYYLNMLNTNSK